MNNLDKLARKFMEETGRPFAHNGFWFMEEFVEWLANRPTCGQEQRKFLDEIEAMEYAGNGLVLTDGWYLAVVEDCFESDLQEVIKGE